MKPFPSCARLASWRAFSLLSRRAFPLLLVVGPLVSVVLPARAQSLFAREGIGLWREGYGLAARGAGGTAIGRIEPFPSSALNPAAAAFASVAQAHVGYLNEQSWSETARGEGGRAGGVRLPGIRVLLPIVSGTVVGFGYRDLTDGTYQAEESVADDTPEALTRRIEGRGSLGGYTVSVSQRLLAGRLGVGVEGGLARGTLRESLELDFDAPELRDSREVLRTRLEDGSLWTIGLQARVAPPLSVGGFWQASTDLRLTSLYENGTGVELEDRARLELPSALGAGAVWAVRPGLEISADYIRRAWSEAKFSGTGDATDAAPLADLPDAVRVGAGLTRRDPSVEQNDPLSRRLVWRVGAAREELGIPTPSPDPIVAWSATAGLGLPIQKDRGSIDLLFELGKRGDVDDVGLSETFLRFGIAVGFGQLQPAF